MFHMCGVEGRPARRNNAAFYRLFFSARGLEKQMDHAGKILGNNEVREKKLPVHVSEAFIRIFRMNKPMQHLLFI